jgi:hypothetical protein
MENEREPDYTEIRDDRIRTKICELMSEMLDNPDEHDIYPTSRFMWKMETFILAEAEKLEVLRKALERIGGSHDCGCHPVCRCNSPAALGIWKEDAKSIANEALKAVGPRTVPCARARKAGSDEL